MTTNRDELLARMADHPGVRCMVQNGVPVREAAIRQRHFDRVASEASRDGLLPGQWNDAEIIDD